MEGNIRFESIRKVADIGFKVKDFSKISKVDSISPPSVFIGSKLKYPLVNVGILSPLNKDENSWLYDDAKYWADNNLNIEEVMSLRNGLLNSRFQAKVSDIRLNKKFVEIAKDVAISSTCTLDSTTQGPAIMIGRNFSNSNGVSVLFLLLKLSLEIENMLLYNFSIFVLSSFPSISSKSLSIIFSSRLKSSAAKLLAILSLIISSETSSL